MYILNGHDISRSRKRGTGTQAFFIYFSAPFQLRWRDVPSPVFTSRWNLMPGEWLLLSFDVVKHDAYPDPTDLGVWEAQFRLTPVDGGAPIVWRSSGGPGSIGEVGGGASGAQFFNYYFRHAIDATHGQTGLFEYRPSLIVQPYVTEYGQGSMQPAPCEFAIDGNPSYVHMAAQDPWPDSIGWF
jgi:hypothetical protein